MYNWRQEFRREAASDLHRLVEDGIKDEEEGIEYWGKVAEALKQDSDLGGSFVSDALDHVKDERKHLQTLKAIQERMQK